MHRRLLQSTAGGNHLAVGSVLNVSTVATEHRVSDCGNRLAVGSVANAATVATEHRVSNCGEAALAHRLRTRAAGKTMLARVVDRASASQESVSNRIARLCYIL